MDLFLTPQEMIALLKQDPATEKDGGFQSLIVKLQKKTRSHIGIDIFDT